MSGSSTSSSFTTTPPKHPSPPEEKKAKAISARACDQCRRRKTRCSNQTGDGSDICTYCKSAGKECTYEPVKRGPPKTYVESLENRMEAMEELLRNLSASSGIDLVALMGDNTGDEEAKTEALERVAESLALQRQAAEDGTTPPRPHPPPQVPQAPPKGSQLPTDELIDELRYFGPSSGPYLGYRVVNDYAKEATMPMDLSASLVEDLLEREHHASSKHCPLPPADLTQMLIDAYFSHFNDQYPLLHRPSFERALAAGMVDTNPSFRGLVLMMLALGAIWVDDPRLAETNAYAGEMVCRGYQFYSASMGRPSPTSIIIPSSLFDIQASALGVVWLLGAMSPMSTWSASGHALRKAIDVGVHREARARWTSSVLEDQLRKRAFWMLYSLDRNVSACMGRPVAMADEDTDLAYPLDIDDAALDEWNLRGAMSPQPPLSKSPISSIESIARLEKIHGQILKRLYGMVQPQTSAEAQLIVSELDSALNAWLNSVPMHLRWNPDNPDPKMLVCSAAIFAQYYHAQILVHREFLSPARARLVPFPSLAIVNNAARSVAQLLDTLRSRDKVQDTFWWAPFAAGTSALILLLTLLAQGPAGASMTASGVSDLEKCLLVNQDLAQTCCMARKCAVGIAKLAAVADQAIGNGKGKLTERLGLDVMAAQAAPRKATIAPSSVSSDPLATPPPNSWLNLPLTTDDLSLRTFKGDPTFSPNRPPPTSNAGASPFNFGGAGADFFGAESSLDPTVAAHGFGAPSDFSWDPYQNLDWPFAAVGDDQLMGEIRDSGWFQSPKEGI